MTFGQMLLEMVEGRPGSSRRSLTAAAATGAALVAATAARTVARRARD